MSVHRVIELRRLPGDRLDTVPKLVQLIKLVQEPVSR
jgi:hypothetical protein